MTADNMQVSIGYRSRGWTQVATVSAIVGIAVYWSIRAFGSAPAAGRIGLVALVAMFLVVGGILIRKEMLSHLRACHLSLKDGNLIVDCRGSFTSNESTVFDIADVRDVRLSVTGELGDETLCLVLEYRGKTHTAAIDIDPHDALKALEDLSDAGLSVALERSRKLLPS